MLNKICNLCFHYPENTICTTCEFPDHKVEYISKRKCKRCSKTLPLNRYFKCNKCFELPNESEYDTFDDMDIMTSPPLKINTSPIIVTVEEKKCCRCFMTKPANQFTLMRKSTDGLFYSCKECKYSIENKRKRENRLYAKQC